MVFIFVISAGLCIYFLTEAINTSLFSCVSVKNKYTNYLYIALTLLNYNITWKYLALKNCRHVFFRSELGQHRTIAEASAVESPIRQETIGFPAHFFARAH
ncbi:MAG: hypothetical protein KH202_07380, partial [Clostridiales bacterium]|nr:hypothetical protein [Clostridiales bacterium]